MSSAAEMTLRELAEAHRGEIDPDYAEPVTPKRLNQIVSLRLDPEHAIALRELAVKRDVSVSDLLREGVDAVLRSPDPDKDPAMTDHATRINLAEQALKIAREKANEAARYHQRAVAEAQQALVDLQRELAGSAA